MQDIQTRSLSDCFARYNDTTGYPLRRLVCVKSELEIANDLGRHISTRGLSTEEAGDDALRLLRDTFDPGNPEAQATPQELIDFANRMIEELDAVRPKIEGWGYSYGRHVDNYTRMLKIECDHIASGGTLNPPRDVYGNPFIGVFGQRMAEPGPTVA